MKFKTKFSEKNKFQIVKIKSVLIILHLLALRESTSKFTIIYMKMYLQRCLRHYVALFKCHTFTLHFRRECFKNTTKLSKKLRGTPDFLRSRYITNFKMIFK